MKIFLAYKFTDVDVNELETTLKTVINTLESLGHEVFCFYRDVKKWGTRQIAVENIFPQVLPELEKTDTLLLISLCENKSVGVGIEIGYAKALNKAVLILKKNSISDAYLASLADKCISFQNTDEIPSTVASLL